MTNECFCINCGSDFRTEDIPKESLQYYGNKEMCISCNRPSHYSSKIGIYDRKLDRTVEWLCPFCGHREPR